MFTAPAEVAPSAAANSPVAPVMGPSSVVVLTGPEHMRQRKLLLPPFHGERMREYEEVIVEATRRDMAGWPLGRPMRLQPRTRAITLEVILRAVFGVEAERMGPLRSAIGELLDPTHTLVMLRFALSSRTFDSAPAEIRRGARAARRADLRGDRAPARRGRPGAAHGHPLAAPAGAGRGGQGDDRRRAARRARHAAAGGPRDDGDGGGLGRWSGSCATPRSSGA